MRALLVVNPVATATTARTRDVIARALGSELKVDVEPTGARGHATELAARAAADGYEAVVVLGGDGTVNEVVNGLLERGPHEDVPLLGVVPGGSTNVLARALGVVDDPFEATGQLIDAFHERRVRRIGLGRADDRWFTFAAGMGLDADVVNRVEDRRRHGARSTHALYVRSAVRQFYLGPDRRAAPLTLEVPGEEPVQRLFLAVVQNASPWTYLGGHPVNPSPDASFETGLDVFALRRTGTLRTLRHATQLVRGGEDGPHGRAVVRHHDLPELVLRADHPVALQVDGDALGERERVVLRAVPEALGVLV
ncbi:MAG: diacylglycerol/lipid kinase family protein [Motilibacteraceae bacterium]